MFAQVNAENARRERWLRLASLALHGLLLLWLLHPPAPLRLTSASVALGQNGNSVTRLYWPSIPTTAPTVRLIARANVIGASGWVTKSCFGKHPRKWRS